MDHLLACSCGEVIVKSSPGVIKIRNKILVFRDGEAYAACPNCGSENKIPVKLQAAELAKSDRRPKLFVQGGSKIVDKQDLKK